ncbi:MAG: hypothetical protein M3011_00515 [Actinomycetota bacterium]|nr:hypothetical protein [Actinomycetota bacterium]
MPITTRCARHPGRSGRHWRIVEGDEDNHALQHDLARDGAETGASLIVLLGMVALPTSPPIIQQYERGVLFRLGQVIGEWAPAAARMADMADGPGFR